MRAARSGLVLLAALVMVAAPRALLAQTPPAPAAAPEAGRDEAQGAAAQHAAQELEIRVIELQRRLDAMEQERASVDDLRRRLDELEARNAEAQRHQAFADWTSVPDTDETVRFRQNGVVVRSPNGRFLLRPQLRLQTIYTAQLAEAGPDDVTRPDLSAFTLAHAELLLEGHAVSRHFEYRLELDFAETGPDDRASRIVKDAFVQWVFGGHGPHEYGAVRVGRVKVPFGYQPQIWNAYLELVDVSQATRNFSLDRDVGLEVVGRPFGQRFHYQLAVLDGPRGPCPVQNPVEALPCDATNLAYAARFAAAPFGPLPVTEGDEGRSERPLVQLGVSGAFQLLPTDVRVRTGAVAAPLDLDGNRRVDNIAVWQMGAELRAVWMGASLQGEWFGRLEHPGAQEPDRTYWGAYGQAGYFVLPHRLQAIARVGRTDQPLYGATPDQRLAAGTATTEVGGGLSAYLRGHDAKLQVDYAYLSTPDARSTPFVNRLRAAVQLAF
jgi:hypothetical protein